MADRLISAAPHAREVSASMAGFSLSMFTMGYLTLFLIGAVAGGIAWFYKLTHADPKWTRGEATSEALKQIAISAVFMPGAIEFANPFLQSHGFATFGVQILVGFLASFMGVELLTYGFGWFKRKTGGDK